MTPELKEAINKLRIIRSMAKTYGVVTISEGDSRAIDTVLSHINTGNKKGLDDRLQEKSIEVSDSQEGLSNKKDRLYTAKDMEEFAEWCSYVPYAQVEGGRWANIKNLEIRTTAQLSEQWEQERGEK